MSNYHSFKSKSSFLLLVLLAITFQSIAQTSGIKGTVSAEDAATLPYANVIVLGKSIGTSTNFDGEFTLPLPPGKYQISFQFVGYRKEVVDVEIVPDTFERLDVSLKVEKLLLDAVEVRPNGENPAHRIIRGAQANKEKYLKEIKGVGFKAYTKLFGKCVENRTGSVRFLGTLLEPMKGIFYLSESVSDIYQYSRSEKTEELMASLTLDRDDSYSQNYSNFIELYQDHPMSINAGAVTNRIISPISKEAFSFYEYELKGNFEVDDKIVYKIGVYPKAENGITFEGDIYIIDKSWRLYESQLTLDNPLLGKFELSSSYIEDKAHSIWLPFACSVSLKEEDDELIIYYHNIYYEFDFDKTVPPYSKEARRIVSEEVLEKDSAWWHQIRPIALTDEEKRAYAAHSDNNKGQSVGTKTDSISTNSSDSLVSEKSNQLGRKLMYAINTGEFPLNDHLFLQSNFFSFNTIEGGVIKPGLIYRNELNRKKYELSFSSRYGFASNTFYAKAGIDFEINPAKLSKASLSAGSYVEQISDNQSISEYWNMAYSLESENLIKLYKNNFVEGAFQTELFNGLDVVLKSSYEVRYPLQNNSTYNWAKEDEYTYTPNQALINGEYVDFDKTDLVETSVLISYKHKRAFNLIKGRKVPLSSGFPLLRMKVDYGQLDVSYLRYVVNISDNWSLGKLGQSKMGVSYGDYLSKNNLTAIDYFHFMGNQTFVYQNQEQYGLSYQTLSYYNRSTSDYFLGANFEHDFNALLFSWIPLLKKMGVKSYVMANYLQTNLPDPYTEIGFGLSSSFIPLRVNYHWGFNGNDFVRSQITISVRPK
ncbi:DUF5686 family protein [Marivirga atlantica]|jgi:hypothetical protein|uniref:Carboxypeptidase-like regulatory domain-containing protein n=1 Tax=Marivirga atlantica TaxID=1548457 RepID=A0A937AL29_9BACT|nr:DUF5686 and carboxypeptidase regulatory-like domain-containing protein [Marivirga atlantica]MBL0765523.1 carboxypeptidase-like regulatory domain-containing protein [Marivirga atlantica]